MISIDVKLKRLIFLFIFLTRIVFASTVVLGNELKLISLSLDGPCSSNVINSYYRNSECPVEKVVEFGDQKIIHNMETFFDINYRKANKNLFIGDIESRFWKLDILNETATSALANKIVDYITKTNIKNIIISPMDGKPWRYRLLKHPTGSDYLNFYLSVIKKVESALDDDSDINFFLYFYSYYNTIDSQDFLLVPKNAYFVVTRYNSYDQFQDFYNDNKAQKNYRSFKEDIKEFQRLNPKNVIVFEYYWKLNWMQVPWPIWPRIYNDLTWYSENDIYGLITQVPKNTYNPMLDKFAYFIVEQRQHNPKLTYDEIKSKYAKRYFGEADNTVLDLINSLETKLEGHMGISGRKKEDICSLFTKREINQYIRVLQIQLENDLLELYEYANLQNILGQLIYTRELLDICILKGDRKRSAINDLKAKVANGYYNPFLISPELYETYYDNWSASTKLKSRFFKTLIQVFN